MRSIDSVLTLAEKLGKKVHVIWPLTGEINCKFNDLFEVPEQFDELTEIYPGRLTDIFTFVPRIYFSLFNNSYVNDKNFKKMKGQEKECMERLSMCDKIYIKTCEAVPYFSNSFRNFTPREFLQETIDSYREENMVGVHIRRSDHRMSRQHSPMNRFIHYMEKEFEQEKDVQFFVATDEPQIETQLRKRFGKKIITHKKRSLNRNNSFAIQDAVIDLYCLAGCRKLIGSYWSSFTDAAWQINGIENIIIGKKNR